VKASDIEQYLCTACGEGYCLDRLVYYKESNKQNGLIVCSACGYSSRIKDGIPRFVPEENYADSFGFQWNIHQKTQLDSYTRLSVSRDRLFSVTQWSNKLPGERILEAGSGAGRFTEILLETGADVFSFDFSCAVEANWKNNGHMPNLHLFQGDIYNIPLAKNSFDKVFCLGVLQHTPSPERAFKNLASYVKPGGDLVVDVYRGGFLARLQWKYLLRPLTKQMKRARLYNGISMVVPILIPFTRVMGKYFGRVGARLSPIVEYSYLGLPPEINRDWAVLDTFDMYSPAHDHPQTINTMKRWFTEAGFVVILVQNGPNGVVGRGKKQVLLESERR
jgi:SAM-dependent methyltransferase